MSLGVFTGFLDIVTMSNVMLTVFQVVLNLCFFSLKKLAQNKMNVLANLYRLVGYVLCNIY